MTFFCLDTSTRTGSMALWQDRAVAGVSNHAVIGVSSHAVIGVLNHDPRSHAERLPMEAVSWLSSQGLTLQDIEVFVVVSGPGSFTGLRVGIAAVQGWAFATGRTVAAVPTLDALVASISNPDALVASIPDVEGGAVLVPCVDALRGEVFYGAWRNGERLIDPSVGRPAEVIEAIRGIADGAPVILTGDGAVKYGGDWAAGWRYVVPAMTLAEAAVRIAAAGGVPTGAPHAARPMYVRRTDAEIMRERRGAAGRNQARNQARNQE